MGNRSISVIAACFLGIASLALTACPPETVQIGAVLPLTGSASVYGEAARKGFELAFEEIQAEGTFETPLALDVVDSASDAAKAAELLEQQFKDGAMVALGGVTTAEAKEMIGVVDRYDRILISPSASSPDLTGISRNFYRVCPSDHTAASKMAQSAAQALEIQTIVIIAEDQPYATDVQGVFSPAFEGYGGEVLETIEFPPGTSDLAALVSRAVSLNPDGVYLAGYSDGIAAMISELRSLDYTGKILTTSAFATPSAIAKVGDAAKGVFLTQTVFDTDSDHAHIKKFVEAYKAKYNETPDIYSAQAYDAMMVLITAVEGRPVLPGEVKKGLRDAIKDFPGVTGSIQFDEKGDVRKFPRLYVISSDGLLADYNERVRAKQDEIREKREALKRQLEELQKKAKTVG
ncbi:MAG: ABC transporter substrate-binding protein [Acidobacteriota bacterium]